MTDCAGYRNTDAFSQHCICDFWITIMNNWRWTVTDASFCLNNNTHGPRTRHCHISMHPRYVHKNHFRLGLLESWKKERNIS